MVEVPALERHRDGLRLFSYLMTGSLAEAEFLSESVLIEAGGLVASPGGGEPAGATNTADREDEALVYARAAATCIDFLEGSAARRLPRLVSPPSNPEAASGPDGSTGTIETPAPGTRPDEPLWIEPFPDALFPGRFPLNPPSTGYTERECASLYFCAALQESPPASRAAFLLSDIFRLTPEGARGAPANQALEDARETMARAYRPELGGRVPPSGGEAVELSMRFLHACEAGDLEGLGALLAQDVIFQCPPERRWTRGREVFMRITSERLSRREPNGAGVVSGPPPTSMPAAESAWRLLPLRANGQIGFGAYVLDAVARVFRAHSIMVLFFDSGLVTEIACFEDTTLFPLFELLPELDVQGSAG